MSSNSALKHLIHQNIKKNLKNYTIYFITIMLGVALVYTFNSLGSQFDMLNIEDYGSYLSFANGLLVGTTVFICLILAFIISYANLFFIKRRKKELGIYMTLGMKQNDIIKMILKENRVISLFSFVAGIVAGILFSHGLSFITMKFMRVENTNFHFFISFYSIIICVIFFGAMFWLVGYLNKRSIRKHKLIELIHDSQKNEKPLNIKAFVTVIGIFISVVIILSGYFVMLADFTIAMLLTGVLLILLGTFCFFRFTGGLVLLIVQRKKSTYYHDINLFSIKQITSKIRSNNVILSVVSILLFLSITTLSVGLGVSAYSVKDIDILTPFDLTVARYIQANKPQSIIDDLNKNGFDTKDVFKEYYESNVYYSDIKIISFLLENTPDAERIKNNEYLPSDCRLMTISDYNHLQKMRGEAPITISDNEFLISYSIIELNGVYKHYQTNNNAPIKVYGYDLTLAQNGVYLNQNQNTNVATEGGTIIVPDYVCNNKLPDAIFLNANLNDKYLNDIKTFSDKYRAVENNTDIVSLREYIKTEMTSLNLTLSYIAIYLGVIFMITACAVLALQQMTSISDNTERYKLLRKLGASKDMINSSASLQNKIYFGIPIILALLHSFIIIMNTYKYIQIIGVKSIALNILSAFVLLIILYGTYFVYTMYYSKKIVNQT